MPFSSHIKPWTSKSYTNNLMLSITLILTLSVAPLKAFADNATEPSAIYKVDKIAIDVTAKSASTARKLALRNARKKAFDIVVGRITHKSEKSKLKTPTSQDLIGMVRDMAILSEKTSSVRYIATVSINFKPEEIRKHLTNHGIAISETNGAPVLVIPIFRPSKNADVILWKNDNKWKYTWERLKETNASLIPKQTPIGDLEDIQTLSPEDAEHLNFSAFDKMAQRYGVDDIYIVAAELVENLEQGKNLFITIVKKGKSGAQKWRKFQVSSIDPKTKKEMSLNELLKRAAQSTSNIIDDNWKKKTAIRFDKDTKLLALVNLTKLSDWIMVKEFFDTSKLVDSYDLQAIKKSKAQILVNFSGGLPRLQRELKKHNIQLEVQGGIGIITPNVDAAAIKDIQESIDYNIAATPQEETNKTEYENNKDEHREEQQDKIAQPKTVTQKQPSIPRYQHQRPSIQPHPQVQMPPVQAHPQQYYYNEYPTQRPRQRIKSSTTPSSRYYQSIPSSNLQPIED
ncbi:MAG: DUF2066 domain-containing protein [Alphaproteobacteria bacterium]|nr:DUF2066 domain-containing protein [Alphaproteobacteria bacterium]